MEKMKMRFTNAVAAKLTAAPHSTAKAELIEELSDNLYHRFLDMTGAGMDEGAAFTRAMEDLGDVDELLSYLGVSASKDGTAITTEGGQTRIERPDGRTVVINHGDSDPIIINRAESRRAQGSSGQGGQPQGGAQKDLDALLSNVSEVCNAAIDQAKAAIKQAKDAIQRRTTVEKDDGRVHVHFNTTPDAPTPPECPAAPESPAAPECPEAPEAPQAPEPPAGWEFEFEMDPNQDRFFAGGGPRQQRDIIYGFGYDKAKGGFFTQWGEWKGGRQGECGPRFSGQDASMEANRDGSYSVGALKDLRGIVVQTEAGDVTIRADGAPDSGVIIDGDVDDLDVTCSADGVLTIREGRTASSSFFSRRGFGSADVELCLPCRPWELLEIHTASGDVDLDGRGLDVDQMVVKTSSGDFNCSLRGCGELRFHSASGDLDLSLEGACADLHAETMSGDINLHGQIDDAMVKSASGDIEIEGQAARFLGSTMSGDVRVETARQPQVMELSSKSGDCEARLPLDGPFSVRMKTVSGEMDCQFPLNYTNGVYAYGDGSGPAYSMATVSGDLSLERY